MRINVQSMTKSINIPVEVNNTATGLDVKKAVHQKDPALFPYLQRLVTPARAVLQDGSKLSELGVHDGMTVYIVVLLPCNIYIQGVDGRMHTITVPSCEPKEYTVTDLCGLVEKALGHKMDEYQLLHQGRPVDERRHGKQMLLKHYGIESNSTLVITKMGLVLDINNPQVDVCFLVDCTGSMGSYIEAVKNNIQMLRDSLTAEYKQCDLLFAFVRYTDYDQPASTRTTFLNFTRDPSVFRSFVSGIRADGGGDSPEDIMGGLKVTFANLGWRTKASKILIHIADCPCHGTKYHTLSDDSYPAGDPAGISHESMMKEVVRLEIQYWFGYVNKSYTDQMIGIFNECLRSLSDQRSMLRQFNAVEANEVGEAVKKTVTSSVYASVALKTAAMHMFELDPTVPNWSSPSIPEQSAVKTPPTGIKLLSDLQERELTLEKPSVNFAFKIAPKPFAEGSECLVYHASDLINFRRVVLKKFKVSAKEHNTLDCYMKELAVRTIAATYAREFNAEKLRPSHLCPLEFTPLDIVQCSGNSIYMLEIFLEGKIEKFNNNAGVVIKSSPYSDLLQAFSHYTWIKSGKSLLVCDLQGFKDETKGKVILTDPAIHSNGSAGRYGAMDGGINGVNAFFRTHTCSPVCVQMKLVGQCI